MSNTMTGVTPTDLVAAVESGRDRMLQVALTQLAQAEAALAARGREIEALREDRNKVAARVRELEAAAAGGEKVCGCCPPAGEPEM